MTYFQEQWSVRLPVSATPLSMALAQTDAARLSNLDTSVIRAVWDPYKCPIELLPFLAWSLSVDVWDDRWPEQVKRDVVAAAPQVHRQKGTRAAVEKSLSALYAETEIIEWFEQQPQGRHGTFEVTAFVGRDLTGDNNLLSGRMQLLMKAAITASKPKSRSFDFKVGVNLPTDIGVAGGFEVLEVSNIVGTEKPDPISQDIGVASGFETVELTNIDVSEEPDGLSTGPIAAGVFSIVEFIKIEVSA